MKFNREHFLAIIFYNFQPVFIDYPVLSIKLLDHSKTNFMKVVQNQLLFPKVLMLHANWHYKIVMWLIMNYQRTIDISGNSTHSIWQYWTYDCKQNCSHRIPTTFQSLQKRLVSCFSTPEGSVDVFRMYVSEIPQSEIKRFSMINIGCYSLIPRYRRTP